LVPENIGAYNPPSFYKVDIVDIAMQGRFYGFLPFDKVLYLMDSALSHPIKTQIDSSGSLLVDFMYLVNEPNAYVIRTLIYT
jgi:hypothetical protein